MDTARKFLDRPTHSGTRGPVRGLAKTPWGENIMSACDRKEMTVNDLAKRAGISRSTLYRMLDGTSETSIQKLAYVAEALGYELHELLLPADQFEDVT